MSCSIYKITNQINGHSYIGQTIFSLEKRFAEHQKDSLRTNLKNRPLYSAFRKYGIENFTIELIDTCEVSEVAEREQYWISFYDTYKNGYNATLGGEGKSFYDHDLILARLKEHPYPCDRSCQAPYRQLFLLS